MQVDCHQEGQEEEDYPAVKAMLYIPTAAAAAAAATTRSILLGS
jgi:hypothetical protein